MRDAEERTRQWLRERSKTLFGNADRLEVAYAVARSAGVVHAQELSDALDISPSRVRAQLLALEATGLLEILPRAGYTKNYSRTDDDDPFWDAIRSIVEGWS